MVVRITILILFLISFNDVRSDNPVYNVFQDFVQFSSSVDTYSDVCIRDFDQDKAKRDLFDLINPRLPRLFFLHHKHTGRVVASPIDFPFKLSYDNYFGING